MGEEYKRYESEGTGYQSFSKIFKFMGFVMYGGWGLIGRFIPVFPVILGKMQIAGISIPMAALIWVMIYPMMIKVDFKSIREAGKNPKGLFIIWITNWLINPFTMYGIANFFLFVIFKGGFIAPELATQYLAGAVSLGAAPLHSHGFCLE